MSTNCIRCVVRKRTGVDLLCDECRRLVPAVPPFSGEQFFSALAEAINSGGLRFNDLDRQCIALEAELAQKRRLDLSDKITEQRAKDCAYCECLSEIRQEHWNHKTGRCDWCKLPFPGGNAGVKQLEANQ